MLVKKLGLDEDTRRAFQAGVVGVESSRDWGFGEYRRAIEELNARLGRGGGKSFTPPHPKYKGPRPGGKSTDPITDKQQERIAELYDKIGFAEPERIAQNRRCCGRPWPQTRGDAAKVFQGLKAMYARGYRINGSMPE